MSTVDIRPKENFPDETVLLIKVRYRNDQGGFHPKVWTYTALKVGGRWFLSGGARVPQDAGWGAVNRWLNDGNREVFQVHQVTASNQIWPVPPQIGAAP